MPSFNLLNVKCLCTSRQLAIRTKQYRSKAYNAYVQTPGLFKYPHVYYAQKTKSPTYVLCLRRMRVSKLSFSARIMFFPLFPVYLQRKSCVRKYILHAMNLWKHQFQCKVNIHAYAACEYCFTNVRCMHRLQKEIKQISSAQRGYVRALGSKGSSQRREDVLSRNLPASSQNPPPSFSKYRPSMFEEPLHLRSSAPKNEERPPSSISGAEDLVEDRQSPCGEIRWQPLFVIAAAAWADGFCLFSIFSCCAIMGIIHTRRNLLYIGIHRTNKFPQPSTFEAILENEEKLLFRQARENDEAIKELISIFG